MTLAVCYEPGSEKQIAWQIAREYHPVTQLPVKEIMQGNRYRREVNWTYRNGELFFRIDKVFNGGRLSSKIEKEFADGLLEKKRIYWVEGGEVQLQRTVKYVYDFWE